MDIAVAFTGKEIKRQYSSPANKFFASFPSSVSLQRHAESLVLKWKTMYH